MKNRGCVTSVSIKVVKYNYSDKQNVYIFVYMDIQSIVNKSQQLVEKVGGTTKRGLYNRIHWNAKMIGIKGARGTGKTTLLLQRLYELGLPPQKALFISLDDFYFSNHSLLDVTEAFIRKGGEAIFIDEVHKYAQWSQQLKNIYDFYDIQIVFTGSSIIDIAQEEGDLSRRAVMYTLGGLSFREILDIEYNLSLPVLTMDELTSSNNLNLRTKFPKSFKPYAYLDDYLKWGYYPIYKESKELYSIKIQQVVRQIVEYDMAELKNFDIRNAKKLLQMLALIADLVPFKPNISDLAEKTGINRLTLYNYLHFLEEAKLIQLVYPAGISTSTLQKPEKIYLENTNLSFVLSDTNNPNIGSIRETFVLNQLRDAHRVEIPKSGDFLVNNKWTLEVGGPKKSKKQLEGIQNAFRVLDEYVFSTTEDVLPLWMFGMLY